MPQATNPAEAGPGYRRGLLSSRKPRYLQIAESLREEIRRGKHPVGLRLPTEAALCKRFDISRHTARSALRVLDDLGLIARRRGAGTFVLSADAKISYEQHIRSVSALLQYTNATGFKFLFTDRIPANAELIGWLNVRPGTECIHLHGIRHHRRTQQPYCLGEVYRRASWQGLPTGFARIEDALRQMIEEDFEKHIGRVEQSLSAVTMTEEQAHELQVPLDTPGFRSVRRYFDLKGHLVMVAVTLHPGHLFSYFARFERNDPAARR